MASFGPALEKANDYQWWLPKPAPSKKRKYWGPQHVGSVALGTLTEVMRQTFPGREKSSVGNGLIGRASLRPTLGCPNLKWFYISKKKSGFNQ